MTDIEIPEGFTRWEFLPSETEVEVMVRSGKTYRYRASDVLWHTDGGPYDIIAYRVLP